MENLNENGFTAEQHRYFRRKIERVLDKGRRKKQSWLNARIAQIKTEMLETVERNKEAEHGTKL